MIKFIDKKEVNISLDNGFIFGQVIFETILVKNNKAILLEEHINRMNEGIRKLGIENVISIYEVEELIKKNRLYNIVLKILVSDDNKIAIIREIPYSLNDYKNGYNLTVSTVKKNSTSIYPYIKSSNYFENLLERKKAKEKGFNECIFLNEQNFITECSMSNIFWIKDDIIYTSSLKCGLLNGILRTWVLKNYIVIEGAFLLEDLLKADAVFITNSIMGIMKVVNINNIEFNGQMIDIIDEKYKKYLEDC
ncbi:MAG: aminotransferase class IV [Sarcina sp.]